MNKLKKKIAVALAVCGVIGAGSTYAFAGGHIIGCDTSKVRVSCGASVGSTYCGTHKLYETANGSVNCTIYLELRRHNIYCANSACGAVLGVNVTMPCVEHHQYCPDRSGLCQK